MHGHLNKEWWRWKFTKTLNRFIAEPDEKMAGKLNKLLNEFTRHYAISTNDAPEAPYLEQATYDSVEDSALICWLHDFGRTG